MQLLSQKIQILRRNQRDIVKIIQTSTCKVAVSVDKKNQLDVTFVFFISLLIVAQHVSGNHVPIIRS